jgi:ubiquinone/menaquinone biosynthesis C-methylase UbiE
LNAGCGEAAFLPFLESFGGLTRIVHMDLKKPALENFHPDERHEAAQGSLTELPYDDNEFDWVFCTEVLEHIPDDARAFFEISRVLHPGGLVLISTPTPPAPFDPAHCREGYTLENFREHFNGVGIEILQWTYCFHLAMRVLLKIWRFQYDATSRTKNWMPLGLILGLAWLDRLFPVGKPCDIVVVGRKR